MGTATTIVPRTYRQYAWSDGSVRSYQQPFAGNPNAWLPSTHWQAAKVPFSTNALGDQGNEAICRIYPRPDSETNTWARHRWFYYDGTTSLPQVIPLGARGGAFPYVWVVMQAPVNAIVTIGSIYQGGLPSNYYGGYADLTVTPTGSFTNETFWVRAYGQDGDFLDFIWTASTVGGYYFDATTPADSYGFIFLDPVNGTDPTAYPSTTGLVSTISSPIKTLAWAFGSTAGGQTYPNAVIVARSGTIPAYEQASSGIAFATSASPSGIMAYPGDTPVIDITNGAAGFCFGWNGPDEDTFLQGLTFTGIPSGAAASPSTYRYFWQGSPSYRHTQHNLSYPNVFSGYNQANNSTCTYWSGSFTTGYSQYIYLKAVSETGRGNSSNPTNGENYGIACMYATSRGLAEFCSVTGAIATENLYLKASCIDWTRRGNLLVMSPAHATGGFALSTSNQANGNGPSGRLEQCYNVAVNSAPASGAYATRINAADMDYSDTVEWWYRNSILGGPASAYVGSGNGPFYIENEAIDWGGSGATGPVYYYLNGTGYVDTLPLPSGLNNSVGTECQANGGVFDTTTYELTGTYRTNYFGQRGAEIG